MITFFNKLGNSWVAKIIFIALALSMMAFWGLGGITNLSFIQRSPVEVGSESLSSQALFNQFEKERQNLIRMSNGQNISTRKAIELGLLDRVVQQQTMEMLQNQIREDLGLYASNAAVQKYVEQNPVFQDELGNFDKNRFYAFLMQNGLNEVQLSSILQKDLAFQHLTNTIHRLGYNPDSLSQLMYKYLNEKRDITYILVDPKRIIVDKTPTEEDLRNYYEAYGENFMIPEYRDITVLSIMPQMMIDKIQIPDSEVEAAFETRKNKFMKPEERDLAQMRFETQEEAQNTLNGLTAENFNQTAKEKLAQTEEMTNFGYTTKDQLMEELATPVFTAKKGEIVGPIQSPMGWHIFLIKDIKAAQNMPADQIKAQIRKELAQDQAYNKMYDTVRQVEDILGSGAGLQEAAQKVGLETIQISSVDMTGQLPNGEELDAIINNPLLLQDVFTLNEGETSAMIENQNGFLVAHLNKIKPVSQKPFETVQKELKDLWLSEQQKALVEEKAKTIVERVKDGTQLETQSALHNFKPIYAKNVTRANPQGLDGTLLKQIFKQEKGLKSADIISGNTGTYIAVVDQITVPDGSRDPEGFQMVKEILSEKTSSDMTNGLVKSYQNDFGIVIRPDVIQSIFSAYMTTEE